MSGVVTSLARRQGDYVRRAGSGGGRGPGGGGSVAPLLIPTLDGFSTGNHMASAAGVLPGISGTCAMWGIFYLKAVPAAGQVPFSQAKTPLDTNGSFQVLVTPTVFSFQIRNVALGYNNAPNYTHSSNIGKFFAVAVAQASDVIRSYVQGVEVGTGSISLGTSVLASTASTVTYVGHRDTSNIATDISVVGVAGVNGSAPSATNIADWYAACVAANGMADMPGVTESHRWSMRDYLAVGTTWPDQVAAAALTKTGTLSRVDRVAVWA